MAVVRRLSAALAATGVVLVLAGGAAAITGGQVDTRDAGVGALIGIAPDGTQKLFCSGTLIAPTVFLTAAHCIESIRALPGATVAVTFDTTYGPSSPLISGKATESPYFNQRQSDPEDIAVVILDVPAPALAAPVVRYVGYLDGLRLGSPDFTNVGYGVSNPVNAPKGPVISGAGTRRSSISSFQALTKGFLRLAQKLGGTCTGDSGGPQFLDGRVVSVTTTGDTQCKATNVDQRLDTPQAQAFLAPYLLP